MSKINTLITNQAFELIRDRIGEILIDEIGNQVQLSYDSMIDADILIESINPADNTALPIINISFIAGIYDNKDYKQVRANPYTYNIDVYTNGKTKTGKQGDFLAAKALQKIIGICRYILENPIYKTLGYQSPFIERVYISRIDIANIGKNDAINSMMGRLTFNVVVNEQAQLIIPPLIDGYDTAVKIDNSNMGYFYQGENY